MKKILSVNLANYSSTGSIMINISNTAAEQGYETYLACSGHSANRRHNSEGQYFIGSKIERNIEIILDKWTGLDSCIFPIGTLLFIREIHKIKPDLIHLHNLHGGYLNLPIFFKELKKLNIPVVWTLHDCWSFTGHCPYFDMVNCQKWMSGCHECNNMNVYPIIKSDRTGYMWKKKKEWFTGVENLTIVTPSQWLSNLVSKSYLKSYRRLVINNGIDLSVFKPTESSFRSQYNCEHKCLLLGVAFGWNKRKGLDVFIQLSELLDDRFKIILVGTTAETDKILPKSIISIHKTANQRELAEIYSAADFFVNPTREENYPTVNMEAIACGTPVITFNTGGSPEIPDDYTGVVLKSNTVEEVVDVIEKLLIDNPFKLEDCLERSKSFDMHSKFKEYVSLYKSLMRE